MDKTQTLTNLYNARPTWLDHAHQALDAAVAAAYGVGGLRAWDDGGGDFAAVAGAESEAIKEGTEMTTLGLNDQMKRLLVEIRRGKKSFQPFNQSDEAFRDFDRDVKCLIAMKNLGLIPFDKLHYIENRSTRNSEYLAAIVDGLTYQGELAADEMDLAPATDALEEILSHQGFQACRRDFDRAITNVATDPAQAIANASSTLESVCKAILSHVGQPIPANQAIQSLVTETTKVLDVAPEAAAEAEIKRILGAIGNIAGAIGTLRTKYGAAHGQTDDRTPLKPVHARFAINAMAAVALFLLETALDGKRTT